MKNKKLLIFSLIMIIVLSLGLVACTGNDNITYGEWEIVNLPTDTSEGQIKRMGSDEKEYTFNLPVLTSDKYVVSTVQATCLADGKTTYTIKVEDKDFSFVVTTLKLGHSYQSPTYEWAEDFSSCQATRVCSRDNSHKEIANATITVETIAPTFDTDGESTFTATFTEDWAETQTKKVVLTKYTLTKVNSVEPTVNSVGNIEYYKCSNGKYYSDNLHATEITLESTVIPKIAVTKVDEIKAEYGKSGQKEYYYETANESNKYYLGDDGVFTLIPSLEDLVINELSGTSAIYVNGVLQESTITYLKSDTQESYFEKITTIINAVSGEDYFTVECFDENDTLVKNVKTYLDLNPNKPLYFVKNYLITFDSNGGSSVEDMQCMFNTTYGELPVPVYAGFVFNGWYNESGKLVTAETITESKQHTLKADWYTEGLTFTANTTNTELSVSNYTGSNTAVVVPKNVVTNNNLPVTEIGDNAFATIDGAFNPIEGKVAIKAIALPNTIKRIGNKAFMFTELSAITLPEGLINIGDKAFCYIVTIKNINIPASVTRIGDFAFCSCVALETFTFDENSRIKYIGDAAISYCEALTSIEIPGSVEYFGIGVFMNHKLLTSVKIKDIEGVVPNYTSKDETGETNTIMYIGSKTLPEHTLNNFEGLNMDIQEVTPYTVVTMGSSSVRLANNTKRIAMWSTGGTVIDSLNIPASVTIIDDYALENASLKTVTIESEGESLTIGENAFSHNNLTTILLPSKVTYIGKDAFSENEYLNSIYLMRSTLPTVGDNWNYGKEFYLYTETYPEDDNMWAITNKYWYYDASGDIVLHEEKEFTITYNDVDSNLNTNPTKYKASVGATLNWNPLPPGLRFDAWYTADGKAFASSIPVGTVGNLVLTPVLFSDRYMIADKGDYAEFTKYIGLDKSISVPKIYHGKKVTHIANGIFAANDTLNSLLIHRDVQHIDINAFTDANALQAIYLESTDKPNYIEGWNNNVNYYLYSDTEPTVDMWAMGNKYWHYVDNTPVEWKEIEYNITYHGLEYATNSNPNTYKASEGLELVPPTQEGYLFGSWFTDLQLKNPISSIAVGTIGDIDLYATWAIKGIEYEIINENEVKVLGIGTSTATNIIFPAKYEGRDIVEIADGAFSSSNITTVVIPNSVRKIGMGAFSQCNELVEVQYQNGSNLITIDMGAFSMCPKLKAINIPAKVTTIGYTAFAMNDVVESITVDAANTSYKAVNNCLLTIDGKTLLVGSSNGNIPNGVEKINGYAFANNAHSLNIIIPSTVKEIGESAFSKEYINGSILSITFAPNSTITKLGFASFAGTHIVKIIIPKSVTVIEADTFSGADEYLSIYLETESVPSTFESNWNNVSKSAEVKLATVALYRDPVNPPSNEELKNGFYWRYADDGKTIVLYEGEGTKGLEYTQVPDKNEYAVTGYTGLSNNIVIPSTYKGWPVTELGNEFLGVKAIDVVSIAIPSSIKILREYSLCCLEKITSINIPEGVETIENYVFSESAFRSISLPSTVKYLGERTFVDCANLVSVTIDPANQYYTSRDGNTECNAIVYIGDEVRITDSYYADEYGKNTLVYVLDNFIMPSFIENIKEKTIQNINVEKLVLPSSLKTINTRAIYLDSKTKLVVVPGTITNISLEAIYDESNKLSVLVSADSKGANWDNSWTNAKYIYYGYNQSTPHEYVLNANGGTVSNAKLTQKGVVKLPIPTTTDTIKPVFEGWYTSSTFEANTLVGDYYYSISPSTNLYAKWMSEEEYYDGSSMERAIKTNNSFSPVINYSEKRYYEVTTTQPGDYVISCSTAKSSSLGTIVVYDETGDELTRLFTVDNSTNELIHNLGVNQKIYLLVKVDNNTNAGDYIITFAKNQ